MIICHPNKLYKMLASWHSKETSQKTVYFSGTLNTTACKTSSLQGQVKMRLFVNLLFTFADKILLRHHSNELSQTKLLQSIILSIYITSSAKFTQKKFKFMIFFWPHDKQKGLQRWSYWREHLKYVWNVLWCNQ